MTIDWIGIWVEEIVQQPINTRYLKVNTSVTVMNLLIIFTATHATDSWS